MSSRSARPPRTADLLDTRCVEGAEAEQRAEARGREATDTNQLLITSASTSWRKRQAAKEKAKEAAARAAAAASAPQSKAQRRKLEQLEARKRKAEARSHVLATLAQHRTSAEEARLLQSTSSMGQKPTKRQRLQRALLEREVGVAPADGDDELEVPRRLPEELPEELPKELLEE